MPRCRVVTPDVGPFSFYLDDPARGMAWETFVAERLFDHVAPEGPVGAVGISMGGYGALKTAFARPERFRAVAAVAPMVEPAFEAGEVGPRNRYHYPPEVPASLLGPERDAALYAADHPAGRARRHAAAIRAHDLAIYVDAGSADALHAHDGAELLHRVLWDLDIAHEYRLLRDADHVGPTIVPRLEAAFAWVGERLSPRALPLTEAERSWSSWLDAGGAGAPPPPLPPTSPVFPRALRALLEPARREAARRDPTFGRTYGVLPATRSR